MKLPLVESSTGTNVVSMKTKHFALLAAALVVTGGVIGIAGGLVKSSGSRPLHPEALPVIPVDQIKNASALQGAVQPISGYVCSGNIAGWCSYCCSNDPYGYGIFCECSGGRCSCR